jgi:cation:H+ antiporter
MDLMTSILFALGFVLLLGGAEFLVRGAVRLAIAAGISTLVVGLTVVAYGTSAPELAVSLQSSFAGEPDIAIGNVVGSNISNILLVLGLSAAVAPLIVSQRLVRLEIPLMIGLSLLVLIMSWNGNIGQLEGLILAVGAVAYTVFAIRQSRKETREIREEYDQGFDGKETQKSGRLQIAIQVGMILLGLALLVLGARWLITGAVALAEWLGVSELIIGLTIIAVGTSLPEIATSFVAGLRGERDIAVGNAVGSNIFNILLVLGVCSAVTPGGLPVTTPTLHFDMPVMIAVAVASLPIFFTGYMIARWEGFLFLGYYVAFTLYLFLNATHHSALAAFNTIMVTFVVPLTIITLLVLTIRSVRANRQAKIAWEEMREQSSQEAS